MYDHHKRETAATLCYLCPPAVHVQRHVYPRAPTIGQAVCTRSPISPRAPTIGQAGCTRSKPRAPQMHSSECLIVDLRSCSVGGPGMPDDHVLREAFLFTPPFTARLAWLISTCVGRGLAACRSHCATNTMHQHSSKNNKLESKSVKNADAAVRRWNLRNLALNLSNL